MKKKYLRRFADSMLWTIPVFGGLIIAFIWKDFPELLRQKETVSYALGAAVIAYLWITTEFRCRPSPDSMLEQKHMAQQKKVHQKLRSSKPDGILFGKQGKYYVRKPISEDGHVLLIGGSGSGKSSCGVIPTLLSSQDTAVFAIDIKGELSYKATKRTDPKVMVFNPTDRYSCGYDPLYKLKDGCSADDICETMRHIAESLIPLPADLKDPFWKNSARNLLTGLLIYYFNTGTRDFISLVDVIDSKPVKSSIREIMENADVLSVERKCIIHMADLTEETLSGIEVEMGNHLSVFSTDADVRFALRDNPIKTNPEMINSGISIYLAVREDKLTSYYDLLQLVLNQVFAELEKRSEDANPVLFIIDELPRVLSVGKIERLLDGGKTLRSRKVTLYLIIQSVEALMNAYTESQAMDLISNCAYIEVLDAMSTKTQKMIIEWGGKYIQKKKSWSGSASKINISTSFEEVNLINSTDIMQLKQEKQAMLVSPYGVYFIDKNPYYGDPILSVLSDDCVACNSSIK